MSLSGSDSRESDDDEVVEFVCRKCPGKTFTAAEKDAHRAFHRNVNKRRPGPKSRRSSRRRSPSPTPSEALTLFEPINNGVDSSPETAELPGPSSRKSKRGASKSDDRGQAKKKKSKKNYDPSVAWERGNGA